MFQQKSGSAGKPFTRSIQAMNGSGDSLGVTLPKSMIDSADVGEGDEIGMSVDEGSVTFHIE